MIFNILHNKSSYRVREAIWWKWFGEHAWKCQLCPLNELLGENKVKGKNQYPRVLWHPQACHGLIPHTHKHLLTCIYIVSIQIYAQMNEFLNPQNPYLKTGMAPHRCDSILQWETISQRTKGQSDNQNSSLASVCTHRPTHMHIHAHTIIHHTYKPQTHTHTHMKINK